MNFPGQEFILEFNPGMVTLFRLAVISNPSRIRDVRVCDWGKNVEWTQILYITFSTDRRSKVEQF